MRMSCNGCRVLRKGCSGNCTLRPCLQWIKSPESQANATLFLAKFYGRAGLINLINSGPDNLRPEIFRSLLYDACGRIINPVHGSVGLMCSGNWDLCQGAVDAVLKGSLLVQFSGANDEDDSNSPQARLIMPLQGCDIRHLPKKSSGAATAVHRVRTRKRSAPQMDNPLHSVAAAADFISQSAEEKFTITGWEYSGEQLMKRALSHDSFSFETVEPSLLKPNSSSSPENDDIELELTLGMKFNPVVGNHLSTVIELSDTEV